MIQGKPFVFFVYTLKSSISSPSHSQMPLCHRRGRPINPGAALDKVISQASTDDCVLYRLADYLKGNYFQIQELGTGLQTILKVIIFKYKS